jgi:hypothetical protein
MNISSAQADYLTISSDDIITLDASAFTNLSLNSTSTVTLSTGITSTSSYTIGGSGAGSIGSISISDLQYQWKSPEEFVDAFPDYERIQKMCDMYPGLKIAFEKFKTTYYLVKDDYDTPEDKRLRP